VCGLREGEARTAVRLLVWGPEREPLCSQNIAAMVRQPTGEIEENHSEQRLG